MLRQLGISILALATASCCANQPKARDIPGCYDVTLDPPGPWKWPPIRLTEDHVPQQNVTWKQVVSIDPKRPLDTGHHMWRYDTYDGDYLYLNFTPTDMSMSDNGGATAKLEPNGTGFSGTMMTVTLYDSHYKIDLARRSCEFK